MTRGLPPSTVGHAPSSVVGPARPVNVANDSRANGFASLRLSSSPARGSSLRAAVIRSSRIVGSSGRDSSAPPRQGEWACDALAFDEITGYALGRRHNQRPLIRLEHRSIERTEHIPAHRFLWFQWGDADGPVPHDTSLLDFGKGSDPVFVAVRETLDRARVFQLEPFVILPEGTRQERIARTSMLFEHPTRWAAPGSVSVR